MRNINEFIDYQGILDKIFREEAINECVNLLKY